MIKEQHYIFAFCLLTAVMPIFAVDMPRSMAFFSSGISVIFALLYYPVFKQRPAFSKKTLILTGIIFVLSTASLIWAKFYDTSLEKVLKLAYLLPAQFLLISLVNSFTTEQLKRYIYLFPIGISLASIFLCFELFSGGYMFNLIRGESTEISANLAEFNRIAVILTFYFFIALALLKTRFQSNLASLIIIIPLVTFLLMTACQSAQLAFIVALIFRFGFPYGSKYAWLGLKAIILTLMLIAPFVIPHIYDNFAESIHGMPMMAQGYAGHRLEIWDYVARYALQNPFYGFGIEATRMVTDFESKQNFDMVDTVLHPHNFVLQIWMEFGVIGILIAMSLIYYALTYVQKNYNLDQQKIILPTMMAVLGASAMAHGIWQGWWVALMFHVAAMFFITCKFNR